jgi:general secretion pathway protein E
MKLSSIVNKDEKSKKRIGELLLEHTSLTETQLEEALDLQRESGLLVGEILLKKNYIHPHDIVKVVCKQIDIPYTVDLGVDSINPEIINDIPINYAKKHEAMPIVETDSYVTVALGDPFSNDVICDLTELFQKEIKVVIAPPLKIQDAINRVYEKANKDMVHSLEDEFDEGLDLDGPIDILDAGADEAPVIRFVNSIIFRAVKERASDIHIEPYERDTIYMFRVNGVMNEVLMQPLKNHAAVSSRIKVMAKLNIAEKRLPQDGRIKIKMAGKDIDIRLSTVPIQYGERIVMRILEKDNNVLQLDKLGFHGKVLNQLEDLCQRKHGVMYVTGPTGHGKTTTLFAMLDRISSPEKMIITVEDPVEYEIQGISQIQVNQKIELGFATALRSILRQNPDVIMVGETRDFETAEMAIQSSLTGHFVLSTLHTNDACTTPTRLIDMGIEPFLIASSLVGILAQRLIQVLCPDCKEAYEPEEYELKIMGIQSVPEGTTIYKPVGCPKCSHRGFASQTCVCELLMINDKIRPLILERADASKIKKVAVQNGMITLRQDALEKVLQGITSIDEVMRAINEEDREQ